MKNLIVLITVQSFLLISQICIAHESALDKTKNIVGIYTGSWKMFRLENGVAIELTNWTDKLIATEITELEDRVQVQVTDTMTFSNGQVRETKFVEGFFKNENDSAGDRFYKVNETVVRFKKLDEDNWTFKTTPNPWELQSMGFDPKKVVYAVHVTTKTTTYNDDIDTDHISRLTTVQQKNENGSLETFQFISMKGTHTRINNNQ